MDLLKFNPWWREGRVTSALMGKRRRLLDDLLEDMDVRQMLILSGLRRAGKTTLMFQIIDELITARHVNPLDILYFSFDEAEAGIEEILREYETTVLKGLINERPRIYLFLDEIQKLDGWENKVKIVYDLNPNVKLVLSGSVAVTLLKGTRESLAGRFFDFRAEPLDFDEFLNFRGVHLDKEREHLFETEIRRQLDLYLQTGGFIEAFDFNDLQLRRYFKEGLLERVVFRDLPEEFKIRAPDLLFRLVRIVAERPGLYLDYKNLGNDLGYDYRTVSDYFSYLERGLILNKMYNYSTNRLTSEKKLKRAYLGSTAFTMALDPEVERPQLMEQFCVNAFKARFFWRSLQRDEVDIVLDSEGVVPIEVKMKGKVTAKDAKPLFKFMKRYDIRRGFLITETTESSFSHDDRSVEAIPFWKYWTLVEKLGCKTK